MRSRNYWELHKQIWIRNFESLSSQIREKIMLDPHGYEGKRLEKIVERESERSFQKKRTQSEQEPETVSA